MRRIGGLLERDRPADEQALVQLLRRQRGAGPPGVWTGDRIAIGTRAVSPDDEASPPAEAGHVVAVGDIRLDNVEDLKTDLHLARSASDLEVVAAAYRKWSSPTCFERLIGDFAIAIWDGSRGCLFLARGPFGARPLCWATRAGQTAFASEIGGLLALPWVDAAPDERAILTYLDGEVPEESSSFFRGIHRVEPGHLMTVESGGARSTPFFRFDPTRNTAASPEEAVEGLRAHLLTASRCMVAGASSAAVMLSGGLDSAIVAGAAVEIRGPAAVTGLCGIYPDADEDERGYAELASSFLGIDTTYVEEERFLGGLSDASLSRIDSPWHVGGLPMEWGLLRTASERGHRIVLDGFHGDAALYHGLGRFVDLVRGLQPRAMAREARAFARVSGLPVVDVLRAWVASPLLPQGVREVRAERRRVQRSMASAELRAVADVDAPPVPPAAPTSYSRARHLATLHTPEITASLEVLDAIAAEWNVEVRHPFFDRRLVEYALGLPDDVKLRDGWVRWVERKAGRGLAPATILWRPDKAGLSGSLTGRWTRRGWAEISEIVRAGGLDAAPFVDGGKLRSRYREASEGSIAAAADLFSVVQLTRWLGELRRG